MRWQKTDWDYKHMCIYRYTNFYHGTHSTFYMYSLYNNWLILFEFTTSELERILKIKNLEKILIISIERHIFIDQDNF